MTDIQVDIELGGPLEVSLNIEPEAAPVTLQFDKSGPSGPSAYYVAVQGGFVGTEGDWLASLAGEQGPQGPQGATGDTGPQGSKGDTGDQGPKGDAGNTGPQGATGPTGTTGLDGPKGDRGDTGSTGATGATGPTGPQGIKGDKGDTGNTGSTGPTGATGAAGAAGATGPAGADGADGEDGAPGSTGPTGATGASGVAGPDNVLVGKTVDTVGSGDTGKAPVYNDGTGHWEPVDIATQAELNTESAARVAGDAASQPLDSDLTAIAALSTTSFGRALLALADASALRTSAGLGTSATHDVGDFDAAGAAAAAQAASQPLDSDLTAIAALSTTTFGRALLALADASALRTAAGLGTAATHATGDYDAAGAAAAAQAASQPLDSDLTAIAALSTTSYGRSLLALADAAALRTAASLVPGTDVQAYDAELAALAGLTSAADKLPYFTGAGTAGLADLSSFIRTLLDDSNAATAIATLGAVASTDSRLSDARTPTAHHTSHESGGSDPIVIAAQQITALMLANELLAVPRTHLTAQGRLSSAQSAVSVMLVGGEGLTNLNTAVGATSAGGAVFYFDPAVYALTGKTTKLNVYVTCLTDNVAPTVSFDVDLFPVSAVAGGSGANTITLGTAVSGSNTTFTTPAATTRSQGSSGLFTAPAAGYYALAITPSGTTAANSLEVFTALLAMSWA